MDLRSFIKALPKAELHVHIEGTLEPEMMFAFAQRNGLRPGSEEFPFASPESVRKACSFSNLQDFLGLYFRGLDVLRTQQDFYDLAMAYFRRPHKYNIRHAEIFFAPQSHIRRGVSYSAVVEGLSAAVQDAKQHFGLSVFLIQCLLRHLSEEQAFESLKMAEPYLHSPHSPLIGIGLGSTELGNPPENFARVFSKARTLGLRLCAHAGEEGSPEYVQQAIDVLHVDRIDHGNRALEDDALTQRLAESGITLTVCPLSNERLRVVDDLGCHPIPDMLKKGLHVTVNSDDPAYFGGYAVDNYVALAERGLINHADSLVLARNSVTGSFLPYASKEALLAEIAAFSGNNLTDRA